MKLFIQALNLGKLSVKEVTAILSDEILISHQPIYIRHGVKKHTCQ